MTNHTIGFIGAGNMAHSLIGGLTRDNFPADRIYASNPHQAILTNLEQQFAIHVNKDNVEIAKQCDVLVLAVKPKYIGALATQLVDTVKQQQPLVISVAAGIDIKSFEHWFGADSAIVRCMPNTPSLIGCGASGLFANECVSDAQRQAAESIMRAVGVIQWLPQESDMDIVTALSGSGPAYYFYLMEAMQQAGENLGLSAESAKLLTLQTALGAARMAMDSDDSLAELRRRVTSPGGTTERGLEILTQQNVAEHLQQAIKAAKLRANELAADFSPLKEQ